MSSGLLTFQRNSAASDPCADERGQPIADGDASEQEAGAKYGSDRRRIGAAHKALNIGVRSVAREDRRDGQDQNEGRKEDADGRNQGAPKAGTR